MIPVILCGGSGSRLWPLSRSHFPKQFLNLTGEISLLQETICRLDGIPECSNPLVICNEDHRFIVAEQFRSIQRTPVGIVLEPVARNTAPAITASALIAACHEDDPLLLILSADHVIESADCFHSAVACAREIAASGAIVTFGIVPVRPETGYGYIEQGPTSTLLPGGARPVVRFVEKPDAMTAQAYLASGNYLWNSGMFLLRASVLFEELQKHCPTVFDACQAAVDACRYDLDFIRLAESAFAESPDISIDYAVMEKTDRTIVVPLDAGWSDVGSWDALSALQEADGYGNVLRGDVLPHDTSDCYIHGSENRLIATIGVQELIVVDSPDALLVAHKSRVQDVKNIVDRLKALHRPECSQHKQVFRPWGNYVSVDQGPRHQVKHITVLPGARLSVQMHYHRAEHWIVVSGTALVLRGSEKFLLTENQSAYIPVGEIHALENPGKIPLEIIEVQSGVYLAEDDIVRIEDRYGRTS